MGLPPIFLWFPGALVFLLNFGGALGQAQQLNWTNAYSLDGEHTIAKNKLLTTLPELTKEWRVSFEVKPTAFRNYPESILQLTIGGSGRKIGDRTPAIWFHKTRGILVASALDGKASFSKWLKPLPSSGQWTRIEVSQSLVESKYIYNITIGDKEEFSIQNKKPVELKKVKVYSGNPWHAPQKGSIRNLKIDIKTPPPIQCVLAGEFRFCLS